jgi:hypothetical protein
MKNDFCAHHFLPLAQKSHFFITILSNEMKEAKTKGFDAPEFLLRLFRMK